MGRAAGDCLQRKVTGTGGQGGLRSGTPDGEEEQVPWV